MTSKLFDDNPGLGPSGRFRVVQENLVAAFFHDSVGAIGLGLNFQGIAGPSVLAGVAALEGNAAAGGGKIGIKEPGASGQGRGNPRSRLHAGRINYSPISQPIIGACEPWTIVGGQSDRS